MITPDDLRTIAGKLEEWADELDDVAVVPEWPAYTLTSPAIIKSPLKKTVDDLVSIAGADDGRNAGGPDTAWGLYGDNEDVLIDLRGKALDRAVIISGFRSVHVVGAEILPQTAPGGEAGLKRMGTDYQAKKYNVPRNVMTTNDRVSWNRGLGITCTHESVVEGAFIDMAGHDGDCMVINSSPNQTDAQSMTERCHYTINSHLSGIVGNPAGLHGDAWQNQSLTAQHRFVASNVTVQTAYSGFTLHPGGGSFTDVELENCTFLIDSRYIRKDTGFSSNKHIRAGFHTSPMMTGKSKNLVLKNIEYQSANPKYRVFAIWRFGDENKVNLSPDNYHQLQHIPGDWDAPELVTRVEHYVYPGDVGVNY